jgi:hypothetical protein
MDSAAVLQISDTDVTVELDELEEREVWVSSETRQPL